MTRRLTRTCLLLSLLLGGAAGPVSTQETYRLASAQVITSSARPPVLKLTANGPIAFRIVPAEESGTPASPHRIVAQLYGVEPGTLASTGLEPFTVAVSAGEGGARVTIAAGGLATNQALHLRAGMRSNELEAAIVATP